MGLLWAGTSAYIAGVVKSTDSDQGLKDVIVQISELDLVQRTGAGGAFLFERVPAGSYTLVFLAPGYGKTILLNVQVAAGQTWYDVIYLQKSRQEGQRYYIGGIEVTADRELLPDEAATTTRISSGEIEHLQASSLGDVLELIPGQKFTNPGLENVKQIGLRQTPTTDEADRNASLGTQILVDGVPLSNNANMQIETDLNDGSRYRVTANAGIDLRRIAADNIQSIEIVRGIPSAKYGDLTAGAVKVNTRSGHTPWRSKYKYNPRTQELNLSGGYGWPNTEANFNLNYARSLRDIRVSGDSFSRVAGQLNLVSRLAEDKLNWTNRFYYTRTLDEQDIRQGDLNQTERYNRDSEGRLVSHLIYRTSELRELSALFSVNRNNQDSYIGRLVSRDLTFISPALEEGPHEGYFRAFYPSRLWVKGQAWNMFGQFNYRDSYLHRGILHKLQAGLDWRYEMNNGQGREFDPLYPPRSSANEGDRPRPYDDIPAIAQLSLYTEDEISGHLWRDFSLQLGARLDMPGFNGFSLNSGTRFIQSDFGYYFNPRVNFVYFLSSGTQMRLGYGQNVKAPTMSMVYPNPVYFDVIDSMRIDSTAGYDDSFAIINTHIIDRTNTTLKAMRQTKYEISLDQKIGIWGISLTGFYERMRDGFETAAWRVVSLSKYQYPNWPQTLPAIPGERVLLNYGQAINSVQSIYKGAELSVVTKRIEALNTTLRVDAAYHYSKSWNRKNHFEYGGLQTVAGFDEPIIPFWNRTGLQSEQLILHYRFDTLIKPLGLWFTLNVQQVALEKDRYTGLTDSLAVGYYTQDGIRHVIEPQHRNDEAYSSIRRVRPDYLYKSEDRPDLWLLNLRVSKELWQGSEVSFFVNNMFNSRPLYQRQRVPQGALSYVKRNPEIFYGIEFSTVFDDFVDYVRRF